MASDAVGEPEKNGAGHGPKVAPDTALGASKKGSFTNMGAGQGPKVAPDTALAATKKWRRTWSGEPQKKCRREPQKSGAGHGRGASKNGAGHGPKVAPDTADAGHGLEGPS